MQLILYMMFAIRYFLTNACNCTTLDAAKVDSTFFFNYMLYISQNTDCGVWFVFVFLFFYQKFLWMRNIFRLALPKNRIKLLWHFFKNVTPNSIGYNSCHFSGFFFNLWDLWQIHSNQETRQLFGVKTKMSWFVIDFVGLAYTDKMNAINRFMRVFTSARDGLRQSWQWRFFLKKLARWYPNVAKTQFLMTPKV